MNAAAVEVMKDLTDLCVGYGVSDEYSFVFHPSCQLFERRNGLVTALASGLLHLCSRWILTLWAENW